jgi:hypothetical protein
MLACFLETIAANLEAIKIEHERETNLGIINYILDYKNEDFVASSKLTYSKLYSSIVNLRKLYACIVMYDDSNKSLITLSKWKRFTKELAFYGRKGFFAIDFQRLFEQITSEKNKNKMGFEEFIEALEQIAYKCFLSDHTSTACEKTQKLLKLTVRPFFERFVILIKL